MFTEEPHYTPGTQENDDSFLSRDLVMRKDKELEFPEGPEGPGSASRILMKGSGIREADSDDPPVPPTEEDINQLYYSKVKLPESYFKKYEVLPKCPVKSYNYNWGNCDFPRNWCILDFIEWTKKYNICDVENIGCTCETDPELEFIKFNKKTYLPYPEYDLHTISKHFKNEFDFFIFNQTLEHLYNPFESVKQIYETIKPGGYVFTSVPTINIPHNTPIHFNGFTPMGLAMLFKTANFEVIEIGQWGNCDYITQLWGTRDWPGYDKLNKNNIVTNEEKNACQCWILARKL